MSLWIARSSLVFFAVFRNSRNQATTNNSLKSEVVTYQTAQQQNHRGKRRVDFSDFIAFRRVDAYRLCEPEQQKLRIRQDAGWPPVCIHGLRHTRGVGPLVLRVFQCSRPVQ